MKQTSLNQRDTGKHEVKKRKKAAGTTADRQTKMTNIPENRNVRRLIYTKISGRRIRRLLGDQHVSEDSGVAVFHEGG
ncbi:hypothetical protein JCM19045_687 [Bacillus sp. JCM 19045]|nr:hypothetical protein JCM19045_687 [Bacillus sp. JCM 19045]